MAQYNAIKAAVNAYIKANGRKEITGQILNSVLNATIDSLGRFFQFAGEAYPSTDPGTPDQNVTYLAGVPGTYTHFNGLVIDEQEIALLMWNGSWVKHTMLIGIREVVASVDNQVGTPSVDVNYDNAELSLAFHNMKGDPGTPGAAAGFGSVTADVDANIGTPGVSVETSGLNTAKNFTFHFTNLKGQKGDTGVTAVTASVDNNTGVPYVEASLSGQTLVLAFHNMKGQQGDTGSSVDYPYTLVNNVTTDDATQGLSAAMGVYLQAKIDQLEHYVTKIFPYDAKLLLVGLLKKIAYIRPDVQDDVDDLEDILLTDADLVSLQATFTPGSAEFYPGEDLDVLRPYLEVVGIYDDLSEREIITYVLSGTLTAGTSTITVYYGGKTTTFNVTVEDVEYVLSGNLVAGRVSLRSAFSSSNVDNAATINGVTYYYTNTNAASKRACYYLFDILLTPGQSYDFEISHNELPSGYSLFVGLPFFNESFRVAGVANSRTPLPQNHESDIVDSGWLTPTDADGKAIVTYTAPASTVGTRIALKVQSGGTDQDWPLTAIVTKIVVRKHI